MTKQLSILLIVLGLFAIASAQAPNLTVSSHNLVVSQIYIPRNSSVYSPLPISFNISNTGLNAFNNMSVDITIVGPSDAATSFSVIPLSPGQTESILVYMPNATTVFGTYYAYVNASYVSGGIRYRAGSATQYNIIYSPYAQNTQGIKEANPISGLNFTYLPYATYVQNNNSFRTQLGIQNLEPKPIFVNISVPSKFASVLTFSTKLLYIAPNQSLITNLLFNAPPRAMPLAYTIPVTITRVGSSTLPGASQTEYLNFYTIENVSGISNLYNQVYLSNNTHSAGGTLLLYSPSAYDLRDSIIKMILSDSLTSNLAGISAFGSQSNITSQGSNYVIQWHVGPMPKGQTRYVYYSADAIKNVSALKNAEIILMSSEAISSEQVFKLVNTTLPALYTNSEGNITVNIMYTGTSASTVSLNLNGPAGVSITNSNQKVTAYPNMVITGKFGVNPGNSTGTEYLTLSVSSGGTATSYSLPIIVLQNSPALGDILQTQVPLFKYIVLTIIVIAAVLFLSRGRIPEIKQPYRPDMARKLIGIREQIQNYEGKEHGESLHNTDLFPEGRRGEDDYSG